MRSLWRVIAFVIALGFLLGMAGRAEAAEADSAPLGPLQEVVEKGLDGLWNTATNDCPPEAPRIQGPRPPLAGAFLTEPTTPFERQSGRPVPDDIFAERGFAGLSTVTYDQGCIITPVDAGRAIAANTENDFSNKVAGFGMFFTALAHHIDSLSWDFSWLKNMLGVFAAEMVRAVGSTFAIFTVVGLVFLSVTLGVAAMRGRGSVIVLSIVWAFAAVGLGVVILSRPFVLSDGAATAAESVASVVYGTDANPADAITNDTMKSVHWRGLERRYFGDTMSDVAKNNTLPTLYRSTGYTWAEEARIKADPAAADELWRNKMIEFDNVTSFLAEHAPEDYRDLSNLDMRNRTDYATAEAMHAASVGLFRIASAAMRIMCVFSLLIVGFLWLATLPVLVTQQGERMGRGLVGNGVRGVGYALLSIIGSFGFGLWARAAMAPGVPVGTSMILLVLGTILFWSLIRPDRKLLAIATMGKIDGTGKASRKTRRMLMRYLITRSGAKAGARDAQDRSEPRYWTPSEDYTPPVYEGEVVDEPRRTVYAQGLPERSSVVEGEVVREEPLYRRDALPAQPSDHPRYEPKPAAGTTYEVELYRREPNWRRADDDAEVSA